MANSYVITAVSYPALSGGADSSVTINATVNGVPVSVQALLSVYQKNLGTALAFQNWATPLLLNAYAFQAQTPLTPPVSSWTV